MVVKYISILTTGRPGLTANGPSSWTWEPEVAYGRWVVLSKLLLSVCSWVLANPFRRADRDVDVMAVDINRIQPQL